MFANKRLIASAAVCLSLGLAAASAAAGEESSQERKGDGGRHARLKILERPGEHLERSIEVDRLRDRYAKLLERAKAAGVAPEGNLLEERTGRRRLREGIERLRERLEDGEPATDGEPAAAASTSVASGTLEAIASCESGGDPTAVNPAGYYGKYQFDLGTWQSVGGTGNPAEAPEAEQDTRAAMLYERAGASPWPVCGA